jgi:hypothetical protein
MGTYLHGLVITCWVPMPWSAVFLWSCGLGGRRVGVGHDDSRYGALPVSRKRQGDGWWPAYLYGDWWLVGGSAPPKQVPLSLGEWPNWWAVRWMSTGTRSLVACSVAQASCACPL